MQDGNGADNRERTVFLASSANILADPSAGDKSQEGDIISKLLALPQWMIGLIAAGFIVGFCVLVCVVGAAYAWSKKTTAKRGRRGESTTRTRDGRLVQPI